MKTNPDLSHYVICIPVFSFSIVEENTHAQCHARQELIKLVAQTSQDKSKNNDRIVKLIFFKE